MYVGRSYLKSRTNKVAVPRPSYRVSIVLAGGEAEHLNLVFGQPISTVAEVSQASYLTEHQTAPLVILVSEVEEETA